MACLKDHHRVLTDGVGKCSVPMWQNGFPNGFCDKPAFGNFIPGEQWFDGHTGRVLRYDGKFNGLVPGLACEDHGGPERYDAMNTNKLINSLYDGLKAVQVTFNDDEKKEYSYKTLDDFEVGDKCIVDSPRTGYVVAEVVGLRRSPIEEGHLLKWVVQKVDDSNYKSMVKNEKAMAGQVALG